MLKTNWFDNTSLLPKTWHQQVHIWSLLALLHGPRWRNFVWMLSCVMGGKSIPCLEGSLTDDAEVGHVQVDLCVSFSGLFSHKRLVAAEAEESSIMSSRYHLIHKRIQVRCEQEHQISDPFRKTTPASLLHSCQSIFVLQFMLRNTAYITGLAVLWLVY